MSGAERRRYTQIHFQTQRERGKKHITKEKEKDIDIPQRWRVTPLLRTAVNTDRGITRRGGGAAAHFLITIEIFRWFFLLHILSFYYIAIVLGEKRAKEKKIN